MAANDDPGTSEPLPPVTVQPVVLAGGESTELWPLSRAAHPKHLVRIDGERTLLQQTALRGQSLTGKTARVTRDAAGNSERTINVTGTMVVAHETHRHLIEEQITSCDVPLHSIILEPAARGTAPAQTLAAGLAARDGDPVLLVMPADHVFGRPDQWTEAMLKGIALAVEGKIVTFGVVPDRAETAFGYIRKGAKVGPHGEGFALAAFVEKPTPDAARGYLSAGKYLWNAGIYMMRTSVLLDAVRQTQPSIATACEAAVDNGSSDGAFFRVDAGEFARTPAISLDYGVMEPITTAKQDWQTRDNRPLGAAVVPLDAQWSDVGGWPSLYQLGPDDAHGNIVRGDIQAVETSDSVLFSTHRLLCAVGVQDIIAVETPDAVLVVHRDRCDEVPALVEHLKTADRAEAEEHVRASRPWGDHESLDAAERYEVKRVSVKPGHELSLQLHHHRAEHWVVVQGTARVTRGEEVFLLTENESTFIPVGMKHRLENPGTVPLEIIEVRSGTYLGEDDIVRFDESQVVR